MRRPSPPADGRPEHLGRAVGLRGHEASHGDSSVQAITQKGRVSFVRPPTPQDGAIALDGLPLDEHRRRTRIGCKESPSSPELQDAHVGQHDGCKPISQYVSPLGETTTVNR